MSKIVFNPFTGNFDFTDSGGSSPAVQSPNYVYTFNATTDWGVATSGFYTITTLLATHAKGSNPTIQVFELVGSDYDVVDTTTFINSITGAISIKSLESPDSRFAGKIIVSENN